ncbi:MAG: tetratricopeptide repeat protein [Verrucomicrobiia bacterium]
MKNARISLAVACALVIGVYAHVVQPGMFERGHPNAADDYYNLLVQGFRAGQLSLKKEVPPGLAQLPDPYDPSAHASYPEVGDTSYYKGKLYLYFGVTPALVLFWPYVALTGRYLPQNDAVVIFCVVGFLVSVGLLCALWRRYFSKVSVWVVLAGALALGLATGVPVMLPRSSVYEVAISCGYMLTMLSLGAIWCALHEPERRCWWLAAASAAYGLAVGARPTLLLGAVILLVPVIQASREGRRVWTLLVAAIGPFTFIGLGLMLYNALRFGSPLEFGIRYQLAGERQVTRQFFNLQYLWFNFRVYFLEPVRWSSRFPFVGEIALPPVPAGHGAVETPFGVLTNIPLVWLALAAPLAGRGWSRQTALVLRWFVTAVALLFGTCVLPALFFISTTIRYEVEFLPALVLLAVVGILSLERALGSQSLRLCAMRWGWGLLLAFSVVFNLLASAKRCAEAHNNWGITLQGLGQVQEAMEQYEQALRISPDYASAHNNLGAALMKQGKVQEAISHYDQALRLKPDDAEAHNNLGAALRRRGMVQEAIGHYEQAVRLKPDFAEAQFNWGVALEQLGRTPEAIQHYEQALRIKPDLTQGQDALARLHAGQ